VQRQNGAVGVGDHLRARKVAVAGQARVEEVAALEQPVPPLLFDSHRLRDQRDIFGAISYDNGRRERGNDGFVGAEADEGPVLAKALRFDTDGGAGDLPVAREDLGQHALRLQLPPAPSIGLRRQLVGDVADPERGTVIIRQPAVLMAVPHAGFRGHFLCAVLPLGHAGLAPLDDAERVGVPLFREHLGLLEELARQLVRNQLGGLVIQLGADFLEARVQRRRGLQVGFGRIVTLYYCSSTLYQIH
jgi:hypothetical protein